MGERSGRASSSLHATPEASSAFGRDEVWLPTAAESAAIDLRAIDRVGVSSPVLMENAGRSAAWILDRYVPRGPVVVVAGSGHNGGDGVVLARTLAARGRSVRVLVLGERPRTDPLTHGWEIPTERVPSSDEALAAALSAGAVVVDAILGTGLRGKPRGPHERVILAINRVAAPVLALDTPSGVEGNTGRVPGAAVRADVTVAFGFPKLGTVLLPGREYVGRLLAVEIGFPPIEEAEAGARLITREWAHANRPRRALSTHKKAQGRLLILAGSSGMAGAAVLAARAALGAGVGHLQVASAPGNRLILQTAVPEALFVDAEDGEALLEAARECDALAAGPGLGTGDRIAEQLGSLLVLPEWSGILLDADALTLLGAGRLPPLGDESTASTRLLTPHPGEMARMGADVTEIRERPLDICRAGAARWSSTLLLKGTPSLVCDPSGGPVWVSSTGSSRLARAGMGDVLTGAAGAFLARGVDAATAAALALHFTGRAADLAGESDALTPSKVVDALGSAFSEGSGGKVHPVFPFVTLDLDPPH